MTNETVQTNPDSSTDTQPPFPGVDYNANGKGEPRICPRCGATTRRIPAHLRYRCPGDDRDGREEVTA